MNEFEQDIVVLGQLSRTKKPSNAFAAEYETRG